MRSIIITLFLVFFTVSFTPAFGEVIFQDDFDDYTGEITNWSVGSKVSIDSSGGIDGSQAARVHYDQSGTSGYWFSKNVQSHNLDEVYIRFYFKMDKPSGGSKFLKLFGQKDEPRGYANTTFAINYYSGKLEEISYGDGSGTSNDTQAVIKYNGQHTDGSVEVLKATESFDGADGNWHCFEAYMKYNSDGKRDGEYQVWIDGTTRIHAVNIKNRHDDNSMFFKNIDLANYCHSNFETPWNLWYDNVVISTKRIGCLDNAAGDSGGDDSDDQTGTPIPPPVELQVAAQ